MGQEHTPEPNPKLIIMNPMFVATLAVVALSSVADATIVLATATTGAVTLSSASVASLGLLGGVALLKGLVLGAALSRRGKRSAESSEDAAFAVLNNSEPAQCYKRLICDMAAGAIPDQGKILSLFNEEVLTCSIFINTFFYCNKWLLCFLCKTFLQNTPIFYIFLMTPCLKLDMSNKQDDDEKKNDEVSNRL